MVLTVYAGIVTLQALLQFNTHKTDNVGLRLTFSFLDAIYHNRHGPLNVNTFLK